MRFLTPTERGYVNDPEGHACFVYAEVTNADGTWINLSDVVVGSRNADFVTSFSFSDNQDANTHSITITLMRDVGNGVYSLSPFRSDSPLNVDDSSSFAPLADLHRQWRLWGCILPLGTFPSSPSDYREWWRGNVDRIDVQGDGAPAVITLQGRGPEADLIDARIIDVPKTYAGAALATWTQNALDDQFGSGTIPLTVDGSAPSFFVNQRDLAADGDMGFFDLISETAALPGALLRYKYDASDVLSFTLFAPNRNPSTPDWSTDGDEYEKLDVGIGLDAVRNYIIVRYMDDVAGLQTVTSPVTPVSASITRYGLRVMVIDLAASTTITDQTAAGNLADAVRSDLEFPIIEHQLTGHGLWFAELGDYVQLYANGVHYDQDQFGGVTSIQHTFENGELKSVLGFRGNPSGRYRTWLDYGPGAPRVPTPPTIVWVSATYFETVFLLTRVAKVAYAAEANAWTRSVLFELSLTADFAVVLDSAAYDIAAGGGTVGGTFDIADADRGNVFYVRATPYSGPLSGGVPTGTAGVPAVASTGVLFKAPTQPEFDVLDGTVTTLTGEPITTWDDPTALTNTRKWVDRPSAPIDLSVAGEIGIDLSALLSTITSGLGSAANLGSLVVFVNITDDDTGAFGEALGSIPTSEVEIGTDLRRQFLATGAISARLIANVKAISGTPTLKAKYTTNNFGAVADLCTLAPPGTGLRFGNWFTLSTARADIGLTAYVADGGGTASLTLYYLAVEFGPVTVSGARIHTAAFAPAFI